MHFSILKGAYGSCGPPLPFSSVRSSQKCTLKKKFVPFKKSKRFFINTIMSKWTRSGACARDPQYQPKVNCNPIYCVQVCVCWQSAGDPNKTFIIFFQQHKINHANKIFAPQAPLHYVVMRDIDRLCTPDLSWTRDS